MTYHSRQNKISMKGVLQYEPRHEKTCQRFLTRSDTNWALQSHKMAGGLKSGMKEVEGLYYLCSENKVSCKNTLQLILSLCFHKCKNQVFS